LTKLLPKIFSTWEADEHHGWRDTPHSSRSTASFGDHSPSAPKSLQCENRKKDGDRTGSLSTIRTELKFGDMAGMLVGVVPFTDMYEQASASSFLPCLLLREFPCETVERVRQDLKL
jgi:hypothetical protein